MYELITVRCGSSVARNNVVSFTFKDGHYIKYTYAEKNLETGKWQYYKDYLDMLLYDSVVIRYQGQFE